MDTIALIIFLASTIGVLFLLVMDIWKSLPEISIKQYINEKHFEGFCTYMICSRKGMLASLIILSIIIIDVFPAVLPIIPAFYLIFKNKFKRGMPNGLVLSGGQNHAVPALIGIIALNTVLITVVNIQGWQEKKRQTKRAEEARSFFQQSCVIPQQNDVQPMVNMMNDYFRTCNVFRQQLLRDVQTPNAKEWAYQGAQEQLNKFNIGLLANLEYDFLNVKYLSAKSCCNGEVVILDTQWNFWPTPEAARYNVASLLQTENKQFSFHISEGSISVSETEVSECPLPVEAYQAAGGVNWENSEAIANQAGSTNGSSGEGGTLRKIYLKIISLFEKNTGNGENASTPKTAGATMTNPPPPSSGSTPPPPANVPASPEDIRKEVRANLEFLFTSEISYYGTNKSYASSFEQLEFNTEGANRYAYFLPGGVVQASTGGPYSLAAGLSPVVGAGDFKIIAIANLDNDPALDIWSIDSSKNIVCLSDDLTATSPVAFNNAPAEAIPSPVTPPPPVNPPVASSKEPSSAPQAIQPPANLDSSRPTPNSNTASRPTPNSRPVPESATATRPLPGGQRSWSPSFDCSRASTNAERLICSSRELSEADVKLSQAYRSAQNLSTNKDTLRREQMAWQKNERDACSDVPCMLRAYQSRTSQLQVLE